MKGHPNAIAQARELGLHKEEYERIQFLLGRCPNETELHIFGMMWSEKASLKNSLKWLKTLPLKGKHVVVEAGDENAGIIDAGNDHLIVFKVESYNHPAIRFPYESGRNAVSATLRDIFTLGARPVGLFNSLRSGYPDNAASREQFSKIVKGISHYSNAFGVPMTGGEAYFDTSYQNSPLINIMATGIVRKGLLVRSFPQEAGQKIYIAGAITRIEATHGLTFAGQENKAAEAFPEFQQANPYLGRKLMEAVLEASHEGKIRAMQELGGGGIAAAVIKMASRAGKSITLDLQYMPVYPQEMNSVDKLLSETHERVLLAADARNEKELQAIFRKWGVHFVALGQVQDGDSIRLKNNSEVLANIPHKHLVYSANAPVYERHYSEPSYIRKYRAFSIDDVPEPENLRDVAWHLLRQPNIASKKWIADQYDSTVGNANLSAHFPADAGLLNIRGAGYALAISGDGPGRYVKADPEKGAAIAVADAARNIICAGGKPMAITDCLNFGNPYNPAVYWQFVSSVKGITQAAQKLGTPVTGGNTSFYNQTTQNGTVGTVMPTPVIGMVGMVENKNRQMTSAFKNKGDVIFLIGPLEEDINSSEYLHSYHGITHSPAPVFDLEFECRLQNTVYSLIQHNLINSAHDVSDGGLFITLLEAAMPNALGFDITSLSEIRTDAFLFGESQSRIIVSVTPGKETKFVDYMEQAQIPVIILGHVTRGEMRVDDDSFGFVKDAQAAYEAVLPEIMDGH